MKWGYVWRIQTHNLDYGRFNYGRPIMGTRTIFWAVTPCNWERIRRFRRAYRLHLQGRRVSQVKNQKKQLVSWVSLLCCRRFFILWVNFMTRDRVCHVGFCGGQSGSGVGFLRVLRFPLPNFIPPIAPKIILIYHRGLYSRPNWPKYQGLR
jgi:hypothetical protein